MALNDDLLSRMVSHQIGLIRLATGVAARIIELLDAVDDDILDRIGRRSGGTWTVRQLNGLLDDVRKINREIYRAVQRDLTDELRALAVYESEYQLDLLRNTVPVRVSWRAPTRTQLVAAVTIDPLEGYLLKEWVAGMEQGRYDRIKQTLRVGWVAGDSIDAMVRRVRGTASANYKDGILDISRRSANTMVRTAVNAVATNAREMTYAENDDLIKGVEWVSTLDLRTTPVCRARDGKIYKLNEGPRPPAHAACRSTTAPVVKSWREIGVDADEVDEGTRASMNGQVAADLTYGDWLRQQPASTQDEVLGRSKGILFRKGGLTMDKFVDASGRAYTLSELRAKERAAWRRAGLEDAA